jgi:hypothetical protein
MLARFEDVLEKLTPACHRLYGDRLESVAVFGSVGRGTPRTDSDLDLLLVVRDLPRGRVSRVAEFAAVERAVASAEGTSVPLSPVFKTPEELAAGSPLLLDMTDDARILFDRSGLLTSTLERLRARLAARGARRIWMGNAWIWDLKPDYRPGEEFEV